MCISNRDSICVYNRLDNPVCGFLIVLIFLLQYPPPRGVAGAKTTEMLEASYCFVWSPPGKFEVIILLNCYWQLEDCGLYFSVCVCLCVSFLFFLGGGGGGWFFDMLLLWIILEKGLELVDPFGTCFSWQCCCVKACNLNQHVLDFRYFLYLLVQSKLGITKVFSCTRANAFASHVNGAACLSTVGVFAGALWCS